MPPTLRSSTSEAPTAEFRTIFYPTIRMFSCQPQSNPVTISQTYHIAGALGSLFNHNLIFVMADWKSLAKEKRDSVNALIPKSWLLTAPLPSAAEQRDVTGKYIHQFLSPREIEITETDAVGIVKNTTSATWKSREVAEAFCHRAALAHQMVVDHVLLPAYHSSAND